MSELTERTHDILVARSTIENLDLLVFTLTGFTKDILQEALEVHIRELDTSGSDSLEPETIELLTKLIGE